MKNSIEKVNPIDFNTLQFEINKWCFAEEARLRSPADPDGVPLAPLVELSSKAIAKSNKLFVSELLKMLNPAVLKLGLVVKLDLDEESFVEMTVFRGTKYRNQFAVNYKGKLSGAMYFKKNPFGMKASSCTHLSTTDDSDELTVAGEPQIAMVLLTKRQEIVDAFTLELSKRSNPKNYSEE